MYDRLEVELVAIAALLVILFGLFVLAGTVQPSPDDRNYPSEADIAADGERYVGDRVVVSGTVLVNGWRFDRESTSVVPRTKALVSNFSTVFIRPQRSIRGEASVSHLAMETPLRPHGLTSGNDQCQAVPRRGAGDG
ncbi:MAG: hypothetical protein ACQET5_16280 [Halobacteriota archaeon]|uniref:hypothetical protein n=1 Tax=Natronomonas sp. TaxID=2184060 RepID=UPI0039766464